MKHVTTLAFVIFAALSGLASVQNRADTSHLTGTFLVPAEQYLKARSVIRTNSDAKVSLKTVQALKAAAESAMSLGPWSVADKPAKFYAPSGDKHDFASMSSYWWPAPDGTYVWRDGVINPDMQYPDELSLAKLMQTVKILSLAGFLLDDDRYSERCAMLIRRWFISPETKMNPHLRYAAGIPGKADGRGVGLHRMKDAPFLIEAIGLLGTTRHWTGADQQLMADWCRQYLAWATDSVLGLEERAATNNHAVYYGAHILALALYVDDQNLIDEYLAHYFQKTLILQIQSDGRLPEEMKRSRPYNYSVYTLTGFVLYAEMARNLGLDYYHHSGPAGQTLVKAFEALIPFLSGREKAPPQDESMRLERMFLNCRLAGERCGLSFFEKYLRESFPNWEDDPRNLLWPSSLGAPQTQDANVSAQTTPPRGR